MAEVDLFGNVSIVEKPQEEEIVQNDNLNLFTVNTTEAPIEETETEETLGFPVRKDTGDKGSSINVSPVYFGKSFEFESSWTIGKKYYNDEYRTSFVTYENCLLACNKTHESSLDTEPKILYQDGKAIGVENIYWTIVLTGDDGDSDLATINQSLGALRKIVNNNSSTLSTYNGILSTMGQNVNDLLKASSSLESEVSQNKKDIKTIQNTLDTSVVYPIILSEDEYDALEVKDPNKFYYIYEE